MATQNNKKTIPKPKQFIIGLIGAIIFIILFTTVVYVNNLVAPLFPVFIVISLTALGSLALTDALLITILLKEQGESE